MRSLSKFIICPICLPNNEVWYDVNDRYNKSHSHLALSYVKESRADKPLHFAVRYGRLEVVEKLIKNGADVNEKGTYGYAPLHIAINHGHLDIVKKLIENGADISAKDMKGRTPLGLAKLRGRSEVANFLKQEEIRRNEGTIQNQYSREEDIALLTIVRTGGENIFIAVVSQEASIVLL